MNQSSAPNLLSPPSRPSEGGFLLHLSAVYQSAVHRFYASNFTYQRRTVD